MLDSIGSPSSILTLQEQKVFRNRHSNLDIIKYKNGKQNYISYIQSIDNKQKYKQFIQNFQKLSYMNKILIVCAMSYYRDIKALLIGQDSNQRQFTNNKDQSVKISIDEAINSLNDIAEGNIQIKQIKNIENIENPHKLEKDIKTVKKQQKINIQRKDQIKIQQKQQSQQKQQKITRKSQKPKFKPMNISYRQKNRQMIDYVLQKQKQQKQTKKRQLIQKSEQQSEVIYKQILSPQFQRVDTAQYKILKLIPVSSNNDKQQKLNVLKIHTDRPRNKSPQNQMQKSVSIKSKAASTRLISNLQQNKLYSRHHHNTNLKNNTFYLNKSNFSTNRTSIPPLSKKISDTISRKSSQSSQVSNNSNNQQSICDKLLSCIRNIFSLKSRRKLAHLKSKIRQQESIALLKKSRQQNSLYRTQQKGVKSSTSQISRLLKTQK